ncbi:hypothetical protein BU26DRAFT_565169 [Trematosphaeria pertusa]|uniref:Uncharacterized protein n=1 Tax=Trematosphaeria pertusa TaxID=390896 RepID=A0A6A6IG12_9PLEO|nr:uncharacterized protein BU26DRAFT_565169 [Trematosphaeria pertusa]KAF2249524.1 hypothetical protein BU26DRAFT_565169 [Trematosphaeria pertusa]
MATSDYETPNQTALVIYWPMNIAANTSLWLSCNGPLEIKSVGVTERLLVQSSSPILINTKSCIDIVPPLTSGFVKGWHKLPDELKLQVLEHNVLVSGLIGGSAQPDQVKEKHLFPYLRMTPEIAALAKEIFYTKNAFAINRTSGFPHSPFGLDDGPCYLSYPKRPLSDQLRFVTFATSMHQADFDLLARLANGEFGFRNLQHVTILYNIYRLLYSLPSLRMPYEGDLAGLLHIDVRFRAQGTLVSRRDVLFRERSERELYFAERIEKFLKSRIVFGVETGAGESGRHLSEGRCA